MGLYPAFGGPPMMPPSTKVAPVSSTTRAMRSTVAGIERVAIDEDRLLRRGAQRGRQPFGQAQRVAGRQDRQDDVGRHRSVRPTRRPCRRPWRARRSPRCVRRAGCAPRCRSRPDAGRRRCPSCRVRSLRRSVAWLILLSGVGWRQCSAGRGEAQERQEARKGSHGEHREGTESHGGRFYALRAKRNQFLLCGPPCSPCEPFAYLLAAIPPLRCSA